MRLGRDGIAGLIGLAVSLALLPFAFGLPKLPIVPVGPGFYPALVLTFLVIVSGLLVVQDVFVQRRMVPATAPATAADQPKRAYGLVAAAFALTGAYIGMMPLLGFRISTALYVGLFQLVLERPASAQQWVRLVTLAVGTAVITYFAFEHYLFVLLPRGTWTGW
jgi:putative tricarboxylic transport membrane protein